MIVVDASVAVKWFYPEEREAAAQRLIEGGERLLAPALIRIEVAAALVKKARMGIVSAEVASRILDMWFTASGGQLVIVPDEQDLPSASRLALELQHPVYDCLYLALAQRHDMPLVTADAVFARRAVARYPKVKVLT